MQRLVAKALFDNVAESPDELAFKRGDVLTVLEQDTGGLLGWWLCSMRGKQGIAPANRLKIMTGAVANHVRSHTTEFTPASGSHDQEWTRRSWDGSSNKVIIPQRQGDMLGNQPDYDVPPTRYPQTAMYPSHGSAHSSREELDVSGHSFNHSLYDTPPQSRSLRSPDSSMYDTPPSQLHLDPYDIPSGSIRSSLVSKFSDETMSMSSGMSYNKSNPPSMCDSARSSMDISPLDMYDVPPTQKEREARAAMYPVRSSKDSGLDMYDSPPKMKSPSSPVEDYDVPRLAAINCERANLMKDIRIPRSEPSSPGSFLDDYDVPKSSRPSSLGQMTQQHMDIPLPEEDYDVPRQHPVPVSGHPSSTPKRHKSNSLGSLLEDYESPKSLGKVSKDDLYSQKGPYKLKRECSDDENNYDEPDAATTRHVLDIQPHHLKQEHAVDELYDSPKNNAPVKNMTKEFSALSTNNKQERRGVYDIPPQVTRDSVISSKSDSSDGGNETGSQRLSTCSSDSHTSDIPIYDELPLDLDAANDLVIKLQQDVQKEATKFLTYVNSTWRKRENMEQKLYDIKQSCVNVEKTLGEFVEFGQGTLANSAKLSDRKLINKLSKYLIPLQQSLQQIRVCLKHLDDSKWQLNKLCSGELPKKDDLGIIASHTKDLSGDVRKLAAFIQGNSSLLFKRAKDFRSTVRPSSTEHSTPTAGKPPISRKPALPAKTLNYVSPVQARPLPAPPAAERPLPPTPTEKKGFGFSGPDSKRNSGDFSNKRNSGDYKHWSGEFKVKRMSNDSLADEKSVYNAEDLRQDYDYVELEEEQKKELELAEQVLKDVLNPEGVSGLKKEDKPPQVQDDKTDSYEQELEKTLDGDIEGVNIYSEDCGTLKRVKSCDEGDSDTGTLKRENGSKDTGTLKRDVDSDTLKREGDNGTLKREKSREKCVEGENNHSDNDQEEEKTPVNKECEQIPEIPVHDSEPQGLKPLDPEDKQVLLFYTEQLDTHTTLLTNSIQAFFSCIENNQAPKVFISHSKFVVVSAHKLVYIGDSLHKNLKHNEVRTKIIQSANYLCDCLKLTVTATKTAALQYPSVPAVQEMVDRVLEVSRAAKTLRGLVAQASLL